MVKMKITSKNKIDLKSIRDKLKSVKDSFNKEVATEIRKRLLNPGTAEPYIGGVLTVLTEMQAEYWGGGGLAAEEDPTNLTATRYAEVVRSEVLKNFSGAAKTMDVETGTINLVLLSNEFLGVGTEGDTKGNRPIQWLSYFLSGNLDNNLYWINQEHYEIFKGKASGDLGRFGIGYMWHVGQDEAVVLNAKLRSAGKSYTVEALKHPQSGKSGKDWFANVWELVDFNTHIQMPAVNMALERMQSKLFKD